MSDNFVRSELTVLAIHAGLVAELLKATSEYNDFIERSEPFQRANIGPELVEFTIEDGPYSPFGIELDLLQLRIPYDRWNDSNNDEVYAETHRGAFDERGHFTCETVMDDDQNIGYEAIANALKDGETALINLVKSHIDDYYLDHMDWEKQQNTLRSRTYPNEGLENGDVPFVPLISEFDDADLPALFEYVERIIQLEGILPEQVILSGRTHRYDQYLSMTPPVKRKAWRAQIEAILDKQPGVAS